MKSAFSFDRQGYWINGKRTFLISGEIPYFRIPKKDWEARLRLLRRSGANSIATYVPWCIHEPEDGDIRFDDCEERDLSDFLTLAGRIGLKVILRPGPYQYAELTADGIPEWLWDRYPDVRAKRRDGNDFSGAIPVFSYLSPVFLERAKRYLRAVCRVIKPFLAQNGGPVVMLQLDNELAGVHIWRGSLDYHPSAMGIGIPGGRYHTFLEQHYGKIENLNAAWGTHYESFADVRPTGSIVAEDDYFECYRQSLAAYTAILHKLFLEEGITEPVCHNVATPGFVPIFRDFNNRLGPDFLLSLDSYFQLTWGSGRIAPTPEYLTENIQFGADLLEETGNPYTVLEMQTGSYADVPPLLPRPLEAHLMSHLAMGLRGVNCYIFAGGNRCGSYGVTTDVYDYHACIGANGEKRPTLRVLRKFFRLMNRNTWLCEADRVSTVRVGIDCAQLAREQNPAHPDSGYRHRLQHGLMYTLAMTAYPSRYTDLGNPPPADQPLLIYHAEHFSRVAQENAVRFVREGGKLLLIGGALAVGEPLADLIGATVIPNQSHACRVQFENRQLHCIQSQYQITATQPGDTVILTDEAKQYKYGIRGSRGKGSFIYLCADWNTTILEQRDLLTELLSTAGAEPVLSCSNPAVCWTVRRWGQQEAIFLINLHHGILKTSVTRYANGKTAPLGNFTLKPLEVRMIVRKRLS